DEAERLRLIGSETSGPFESYAATFRRAQQLVERRRARQRRVLLYFEQQRSKVQREMGLDPYLDLAS
ncbi:MAG TPA: hypothetical protein VHV77_11740, partial [Pirellulales bacterium]|nr:hypothetical protein [Pirellulales bacterium]